MIIGFVSARQLLGARAACRQVYVILSSCAREKISLLPPFLMTAQKQLPVGDDEGSWKSGMQQGQCQAAHIGRLLPHRCVAYHILERL